MNSILKGLREYLADDKLLVDYIFIILKLFDKYGQGLYNHIHNVTDIDEKIGEIIKFFKEKKYNRKDIYTLLELAIKETGYNIYEIRKGDVSADIVELKKPADIIEENINDIGIYAKSADNKIYKRFVLDDVKKVLNLN